jgi:AraC-like DNA-binding protein
MPIMDGIELVTLLKTNYPDLPVIIISGYQEFEYARKALSTGVVDYLLKPIKPQRLSELLTQLVPKLNGLRENATLDRLRRALSGASEVLDQKSGREEFRGALFRYGGLPSRCYREPAEDTGRAIGPGLYKLGGRDGRESLFLGTVGLWTYQAFVERVSSLVESRTEKCRALVFNRDTLRLSTLASEVQKLSQDLDRLIVPGECRIHHGPVVLSPGEGWDPTVADRLEFAVQRGSKEDLERTVKELTKRWSLKRTALMVAESSLRSYLRLLIRSACSPPPIADLECRLDESISLVEDYDQLTDLAVELSILAAGLSHIPDRKRDIPAFFEEIRRWIADHYADRLNLDLVGERFHISPSYLSKLFRKYEKTSFGEFLTLRRIEAAQTLLLQSPTMPLKDVADRVGIGDPFYFSRLFKSVTGFPPSNFKLEWATQKTPE